MLQIPHQVDGVATEIKNLNHNYKRFARDSLRVQVVLVCGSKTIHYFTLTCRRRLESQHEFLISMVLFPSGQFGARLHIVSVCFDRNPYKTNTMFVMHRGNGPHSSNVAESGFWIL